MKYKLLQRKHAEYDAATMRRHSDLFEGGPVFMSRVSDYLVKNEMEPPQVFKARCERAHYENHCARIINFFASSLMTSPPKVVHGDGIAILYADWTLDAKAPDGSPITLAGQTTDVARRQPDGRWLYAIDSPFGANGA